MTVGMIIVLAVVALAVLLFILEPIPIDITALLILVVLVLLGQWTEISPSEAVSGFSNPATITVLALLIVSGGVRRTGIVESVGQRLGRFVNNSERRHLVATIGMSGPISGLVNNTPVVALLMPVVTSMAHRAKISPSKLLLPLSYAAMLGGTLTLIGTSTNILASDLSRRLLDHRLGIFEFTHLGAIVFLVGAVYLLAFAPKLLPERVKPEEDYLEEYAVTPFSRKLLEASKPKPGETTLSSDFNRIVEVVIPSGSRFEGLSVDESRIAELFDAVILAIRSGGEIYREGLGDKMLAGGDTILVQTTPEGVEGMQMTRYLVVLAERKAESFRRGKVPVVIVILAAIVGLAAFDVVSIMVSSLAGVVAMVLTGVLRPSEIYAAVDWRVIFLLAGIIPLGISLEQTGTAAYLGQMLASSAEHLPLLVVLWLFYIGTGLITEVISNNASVLLMIPIAVETAERLGGNPFAFVLAVMFAASTAFMGPVGYQTNLFVYGPGGYRISDFLRLGAPLQILLSVVTVGGIAVFWGV